MDSVAIKSSRPFSLAQIARTLSAHWIVSLSQEEGILAVQAERDRAYLNDGKFCPGFEEEPGLFTVFLDYSNIEFAKGVLAVLADDPDLLVDNDFGTVLPGDEFVR